jgi:transcriptional regulator with XRE-family HTH domain
MKNLTQTLQEKYHNAAKNEKAKLSRFLKRRRIELGKTLEEVSEGICSTSYLSKIENCLVDVDESYFKMLFEKLNLEYQTVIEERKIPIYDDLLKAYLTNNIDYIKTKNNNVIETNSYSDAEIEIILVLYNLVNGSIEEAAFSMEKLELIKNTLSNEELMYLSFLKILYYVKSYKYDKLTEEIEIVLKTITKNELLHFALLDLTLDYYYWTFQKAKFIECFLRLSSNKFMRLFKNIELKHLLQRLVIISTEDHNNIVDLEKEFQLIKESITQDDLAVYHYYYALYLTNKTKYEQAYLILNDLEKDEKVLALMGYLVDKINNLNYQVRYLKLIDDTDHDNNLFSDYVEYIRLKFEQYSYGHLYNYLKNHVLENQKIYKHYYLNKIELNEYYNLAFELGKYKEIARNILNK